MPDVLVEVRGVCKRFGGVAALAGVTLSVQSGEVRAVIGPNGAGKTTLFNVMTGHLVSDGGAVLFRGERLDGLAPYVIARKGVSRTFQVPAAFRSLSARDNVQVALQAARGRQASVLSPVTQHDRVQADRLLERVGLGTVAGRVCGTLSLSDIKRVELALALAGKPDLLLLDEPAAGMAGAERRDLLALVAEIVREQHLTVLFIEHDMDVVFRLATQVTVMHQGRVLAEGDPQTIRRDATVRRVYLGDDR